jgi:hypothetical protein
VSQPDPSAAQKPWWIEAIERAESAERERDEALQSLVRIHTWAGRTLAATPDVSEEQFKAILEDIYAEADERVKLDA